MVAMTSARERRPESARQIAVAAELDDYATFYFPRPMIDLAETLRVLAWDEHEAWSTARNTTWSRSDGAEPLWVEFSRVASLRGGIVDLRGTEFSVVPREVARSGRIYLRGDVVPLLRLAGYGLPRQLEARDIADAVSEARRSDARAVVVDRHPAYPSIRAFGPRDAMLDWGGSVSLRGSDLDDATSGPRAYRTTEAST